MVKNPIHKLGHMETGDFHTDMALAQDRSILAQGMQPPYGPIAMSEAEQQLDKERTAIQDLLAAKMNAQMRITK